MKRRDFFARGVFGSAAVLGGVSCSKEKKGANLNFKEADVVVIGGGTAGAIAAIQAAELGAKTLLVESAGQLGGTMTVGGVAHPGIFHAWGKQVIAGIGWELVEETVRLNKDEMPNFSEAPKRHWHHQIWINPHLYACLAEERALKSGCEILYYCMPERVEKCGDFWKLALCGKNENFEVRARQVIDCTGSASAAALAGFARSREEEIQPGTLIFVFDNYDVKAVDRKALEADFAKAKEDGRLKPTDSYGGIYHFLARGGFNQQHVEDADNSTSSLQTSANVAGRASALRLLRFFKTQKGLENIRIGRMQTETGVRETYRIVGEVSVSVQDYCAARRFEDAIAHCFYPIDLHTAHGVTPEPLKQGLVPTIPLSALKPKGSENFLVAGRSISSDRLANSALRVQAPCMAMGQAAGAAAALSALSKKPLSLLDFGALKASLSKFGAIVP